VVEHHGTQFGVECFRLWEIGSMDLPAFTERMVTAGKSLEGLEYTYIPGGNSFLGIMSAWTSVGTDLRQKIKDSVEHVYEACDALMTIAEHYAATDGDSEKEFTSRVSDEKSKHADGTNGPALYDLGATRPEIV
jgi:hypothetical protein